MNSQHPIFSFWNLPIDTIGGREVALPCCAKFTSVSFVMFTIVGILKGIVGASAMEDTTELAEDGSVILLTYSLNKQYTVVKRKQLNHIYSGKELTQWQRQCIYTYCKQCLWQGAWEWDCTIKHNNLSNLTIVSRENQVAEVGSKSRQINHS